MQIPEDISTWLRQAQHVAVLTGAGISAESGVPTFREAQRGLWSRYDPQELATPEAFARHPQLVWEWYAWRRELVGGAEPNAAHHALVALAQKPAKFTLITQNVDGLHAAAGSQDVVELHGNLMRSVCSACRREPTAVPAADPPPPPCPNCGSPLRPDVVWFGEALPRAAIERAFAAAQSCDVFFSIGTSALVQPAASLPLLAVEQGALLLEINLEPTPLTRFADLALHGPAGELLPALLTAVWNT